MDAKVQEKLVARLRAFAKADGNRVCADCTEKFPGQICLDFNTLVGAYMFSMFPECKGHALLQTDTKIRRCA